MDRRIALMAQIGIAGAAVLRSRGAGIRRAVVAADGAGHWLARDHSQHARVGREHAGQLCLHGLVALLMATERAREHVFLQ